MPEVQKNVLSDNNIRTLVYYLGVIIEQKNAKLIANTPFKQVRASDVRVFIGATRGLKTISDIARHLHISRQSAQSSVGRLTNLGLLLLKEHPDNKREKLVVLTDHGWQGSNLAVENISKIEVELAEMIGTEAYAALRQAIEALINKSGVAPALLHHTRNSALSAQLHVKREV